MQGATVFTSVKTTSGQGIVRVVVVVLVAIAGLRFEDGRVYSDIF